VPVTANTQQFQQVVAQSASGAVGGAVGASAGAGFGAVGERSGRDFAASFGRVVQGSLGAVGLAGGAFFATSLFRGFQRLTTIQDATASLTVALGSATEAAAVLGDVLDVVTGTPFNLDQFATAASNMISFGIEAEKVPGYLTAIGEAAATRGSRANEFAQRLSTTFGQISVQGRVMGEDLLSLQSTGVDALRILGNSFGVTTTEIRKMVSEGAVPAGEALDILSEGILNGSTGVNGATVAFAGTMERLRDTLTGSIGGFKSATARLGLAVIDPIQGALTAGFNAGTDVINKFNKTINETLGGLSESEGFKDFVEFIGTIPEQIDPLIERLSGLGPALAPLGAAFGALGLGSLGALLGPFGGFLQIIGPVTAAVIAFVAATPEIRSQVLPILEQLGKTAAVLGAGLTDALGDGLVELTPLLGEFVEAIADLSPLLVTIAGVTVALAQGLVPALGFLADILDVFPTEALIAIAGGFLAFKAIGALQTSLSGITSGMARFSASLQLAEASSTRFGNSTTRVAGAVGVTGARVQQAAQQMNGALNGAATAAAGFFSGLALSSEDATTQAVGFLGAATSIGTAFAAGPIAGIATSAAVVGGALVSMWVDAKQAAAEYEAEIDRIAREIVDDLNRVEIEMLSLLGITTDAEFGDLAVGIIGGEEARQQFEDLGISLNDFLTLASDPTRLQAFLTGLDEVQSKAASITEQQVNDLFAAGDTDVALRQGELYAQNFREQFDLTMSEFEGEFDVSQLFTPVEDSLGNVIGIDASKLGEVVEIVKELNKAGLDVQSQTAADARNLAARMLVDLNAITSSAGLTKDQIAGINSLASSLGLETETIVERLKENQDALSGIFDAVIPKTLTDAGIDAFDVLLMKPETLAENFNLAVEVADDGSVKFVSATDDMADGLEGTALAAEEMAAAVEAAMKLADAAANRFTESLDSMLNKLDQITDRQDFAGGFRDISKALNDVTNADELKERQGLIEDIGKEREGIIDLQKKLAEEQANATIEVADLDATIADADKKGAVAIAAALRAKRDGVFEKVDDIESEIEERIANLAELESRAAVLSQTPITLNELLNNQAGERGISLARLLIEAPTDESREFFQNEIDSQIRQAGVLIQQAVDDNPLDAAIKIPSIVDSLVSGLVSSGLDAATAKEIVDRILDPTALATTAVDSFEAAFNADVAKLGGFTASILNGEDVDPLKVEAVVVDVGEGIAALEERERLGLTIPGDIDLIAARDALNAFEQAYEQDDFAITIPIKGDLTDIIADIESLAAFALELNSVPAGTVEGQQRGWPWYNPDEAPPRRLPGGGGINSPRRLAHGGILEFFKDGGITENHVAQISRNTARLWSEPETGGEGYIPLHPSKRPRSTRILTDIADMFGLDVMPRGVGAGMDESSMARAVERGVKAGRTPSAAARARAHDSAARSVNVAKIEVNGVKNPNTAARRVIRRLSDVAMGMNDWDEDWD